MIWMEYVIMQAGKDFRVQGDWEGEVMGWPKPSDEDSIKKENALYQPGDVFVVNDNGWLIHQEKDKES